MKKIDRVGGTDRSSNRRMIGVNELAYSRLTDLRERLVSEIQANPSNYSGYAGRRVTLSDVIILLCERAVS